MQQKIKIDIVSDVVCPWCIIGYKRLTKAISELGLEDNVDIEWHPFELNPSMPLEGELLYDHLHNKYGSTVEEQKIMQAMLTGYGAELGFTFDFFEEMNIVNTRDCHVLLNYAKEFGKQTDLKLRLVTAFYSERKDVSDKEVLRVELNAVGLDAEAALVLLENDDARYKVQSEERYWHSMGVSSVPTFVFNKRGKLTGAQPVETFEEVFGKIREEYLVANN